VQTSFLGDMVLTTPLLAALAARGPVDVLATPLAAPLLANHPAVRETIVFDKRGADKGVSGFARLVRLLRAGQYRTAYHAQGSVRSGALTFAAGVPRRVGFSGSAGRPFYTERVAPLEGMHHAARLLSLSVGTAQAAASTLRPRLFPGAWERESVDRLLVAAGVAAGERLIALAPGSVWATKRWPEFPALARGLGTRYPDARVVVVGGAADAELSRAIMAATDGGAVIAAGALSLLASAELLSRCALLVTNDSAPLHLASAMNVPTVAIFGPTVPEFGFGPLAERSIVAGRTELACRPCDPHGPRRCPLGHWRCMREITVGYMLALVDDLLSQDTI
jgi:heptosyltransferase-2